MQKLIYIADDEQNIRQIMKTFLESEGYAVKTFSNGMELRHLTVQHRKGNILHIAFDLSLLCLFQKLVGVFAPCHRFFPDFSSKS